MPKNIQSENRIGYNSKNLPNSTARAQACNPKDILQNEELIVLKMPSQARIAGSLFYPFNYAKTSPFETTKSTFTVKYPGILLFHAWKGNRYDWMPLVLRLQAAGFAVFAIDFRNHGESSKIHEFIAGESTKQIIDDAKLSYEVFSCLDFVDKNNISIVGASIGATACIQLCEYVNSSKKYPALHSMTLLSPAESYFSVNIENSILNCSSTPTFFFLEKQDPTSNNSENFDSGYKLYNDFSGEKRISIFNDIGHGAKMLKLDLIIDSIVEWLKHNQQ